MKTIELNSGCAMPAVGLGTWKSAPGEVGATVDDAVRAGYRHIDCAWIYGNEAEIGQALGGLLTEGAVARDDLWVTSKLWNDCHAPDDVEPAVRESLTALGLEHLDLYLIHWPVAHVRGVMFPASPDDMLTLDERPLAATWAAMEALVDAGLCRSIGVSNFSVAKLEALMETARIAPAVSQIELHPYLAQTQMLERCRDAGVALTAYSPLGSGDRQEALKAVDEPVLLDDRTVRGVAAKHSASPAQVLIAWALARGTSVTPKSVSSSRIRENLAAESLELDDGDILELARLDRRRRYIDGTFWALEGGPYTVAGLWDE